MNKTLLLIMCDFMLLNLLALTRWEKAEPSHTQLETAAPRSAAAAPAVNADMVELMRVSLEDEKASREQLAALYRVCAQADAAAGASVQVAALQASIAARPQHQVTVEAIAAAQQVLTSDQGAKLSSERRKELLQATPLGQAAIDQAKS